MAEKKLRMTFAVAGGGDTTMTLSDVLQNLDETTVKEKMQKMCDAQCFATSAGAAYSAPLAADYVEEVITPIFNDSTSA